MGESAYLDYSRNINFDMLELMGSGYVIDHIVAEHNARMKEEHYRVYISDIAKALIEFTGAKVNYRYYELIAEKEDYNDGKTGDEVALEVIRKLGLKVSDNESI